MVLRRLVPIGLAVPLASCGGGVVRLADLDDRVALDAAPRALELDGATYTARGSAWHKLFLVRGDEAWVSAPDVAKNDYGTASGLAKDGPRGRPAPG